MTAKFYNIQSSPRCQLTRHCYSFYKSNIIFFLSNCSLLSLLKFARILRELQHFFRKGSLIRQIKASEARALPSQFSLSENISHQPKPTKPPPNFYHPLFFLSLFGFRLPNPSLPALFLLLYLWLSTFFNLSLSLASYYTIYRVFDIHTIFSLAISFGFNEVSLMSTKLSSHDKVYI
jgi:hypothetical protein